MSEELPPEFSLKFQHQPISCLITINQLKRTTPAVVNLPFMWCMQKSAFSYAQMQVTTLIC